MTTKLQEELRATMIAKQQGGWLALFAPEHLPLRGYGTRRVAKLMPNGELQFSIGATLRGTAVGLNETITLVIRAEGLELLARESTSGSRGTEAEYPAFQTTGLPVDQVIRVLHLVQGAALQGQFGADA